MLGGSQDWAHHKQTRSALYMMCVEMAQEMQGSKSCLRMARQIFRTYHEIMILKAQQLVYTDASDWCGAL